jgi:hypothetical protein
MYHNHDKMKALVKKLNGNTHLAQTYRTASAITCDWKYTLTEIMGVIADQSESYITGNLSHKVLEIGLPRLSRILLSHPTRDEIIALLREPMNKIFERERNRATNLANIEYHIGLAKDRLDGISQALEDKMRDSALPRRILTEITITNTLTRQEGRVVSIFEYDNQSVETVDSSPTSGDASPSPNHLLVLDVLLTVLSLLLLF